MSLYLKAFIVILLFYIRNPTNISISLRGAKNLNLFKELVSGVVGKMKKKDAS